MLVEGSLLFVGTIGRSNILNLIINLSVFGVKCLLSANYSKYFIISLYHPPDPVYVESDLLLHLTETCELIHVEEPNTRIIIVIAGDINHINIKDLISQHNLKQIIIGH